MFVFVVLLSASGVRAETLTGHVIGVSDGDTITVQIDRQRVRVRINAIDAPEMRQSFGQSARRSLSELVFQREVRLDCHKTDRYKRKVCKVWAQPMDCSSCEMTLDVGHAQVSTGMAWWFREYAKEQTAEDRELYESAENEARERHRGLWTEFRPTPPWEWRRARN